MSKIIPISVLSADHMYENEKKQEEDEKESIIALRTRRFLEDVSVVGVKYVASSNDCFRKLFWLSLVLFGVGFFTYQLHDRISYYLEHPTSVDIEVADESQIPFPTVTVCNENIISKKWVQYDANLSEAIQSVFPIYYQDAYYPNETHLAYLVYNTTITNLNWRDTLDNISPTSESLNTSTNPLVFISYSSYNALPLETSDFDYVRTDLGLCLQFNGGSSKRNATTSGSKAGLFLLMHINQSDYHAGRSRGAGVRVRLHHSLELPKMLDLGVGIGTGKTYKMAMNYKTISRLPAPYSDCNDNSSYKYYTCLDDCKTTYIVKQCGCQFYNNYVANVPVCDPYLYFTCALLYEWIFLIDTRLTSACSCPYQCDENIFDFTLTSEPISGRVATILSNVIAPYVCGDSSPACLKAGYDSIYSEYVEIEIYFSEMRVETITTSSSYTVLALFCDIGGAMGLILGSTVLTLFEVGDYIVLALIEYIAIKFSRKRTT